jgi:ubiquinone/menaquinone biosynthesis C-methylase UbiE
MLDLYESLADRYDWMKMGDPVREEFFRRLFRKNGVYRALDCACGTGKDLIMINSFGCKIAGSDLSDAMLAQARKNLAGAGLKLNLRKVDFRELETCFAKPFDAVVCLSSAINEVLEDSEAIRALKSMKSVLRPGGILVFDQGVSDAMMKDPPAFDPIVNSRDFSRLFTMEYADDLMTVNIFDFVHTQERCDFRKTSLCLRIRLQDKWEQIIRKAGFRKIGFFGDWEFAPYDKTVSKRLIAVLQK